MVLRGRWKEEIEWVRAWRDEVLWVRIRCDRDRRNEQRARRMKKSETDWGGEAGSISRKGQRTEIREVPSISWGVLTCDSKHWGHGI